MIKFIQQFLLKRKLQNSNRKVRVVNLASSKSALLVYNACIEEEEKLVRQFARFLKEEGIKTDSIAYYKKKNKNDEGPQNELGYYYLKKEELNWLNIPISRQVKTMILNEYHLLIDLNLSNIFCLEYIASMSKANFKVGIADGYQKEICDLTLEVPSDQLNNLIEQIKVYLNMINK